MTLAAFVAGLAAGIAGTIYVVKRGWIKLDKATGS